MKVLILVTRRGGVATIYTGMWPGSMWPSLIWKYTQYVVPLVLSPVFASKQVHTLYADHRTSLKLIERVD